MMKPQLMTGMALSLLFSGTFTQAAWSNDITPKQPNRPVPSIDCQLANDPNVRYIKAPDCTSGDNHQPVMDDESSNLNELNPSWYQPGIVLKQSPQEIIYPKTPRYQHLR